MADLPAQPNLRVTSEFPCLLSLRHAAPSHTDPSAVIAADGLYKRDVFREFPPRLPPDALD
jgi:hypothetical protein